MLEPEEIFSRIRSGGDIDRRTARRIARRMDLQDLLALADRLRRHFHGRRFFLCSIINARSGNCSEDCRFCAQSARHPTDIDSYRLIDPDKALAVAMENDGCGVRRLSLVASGRSPDRSLLDGLGRLYDMMAGKTRLDFCASLGLISASQAAELRRMGVTRYHCNLESCREFFPQICTTHTHGEKVETLKNAARAGLSRCSGGIIGMGEGLDERIELALELRDLGIRSIPVNILTPVKATPLAAATPLDTDEVLRTVALFRIINPAAVIRIAGGRLLLGKEQYRCFTAGANGAIVGNYLTTVGASLAEDLENIAALGYRLPSSS